MSFDFILCKGECIHSTDYFLDMDNIPSFKDVYDPSVIPFFKLIIDKIIQSIDFTHGNAFEIILDFNWLNSYQSVSSQNYLLNQQDDRDKILKCGQKMGGG
ncbi:hypothetical protein RF11_07309 [Thelohanellus kitauei]|uniref:Uncharacterized protein n=1 Tax=Thelohanellus kitauei TaxID=669202 RepID=A0A0C2JEN2_THEKT|nr:hypothetical protein RF11_07309 [Thelohanellus kitauei]